jgi:hypothetical protein
MGLVIAPVDIFLQLRPLVIRAVSTCSGTQRFRTLYSQNAQCGLQVSFIEPYSVDTVAVEDGEPGHLSRYSHGLRVERPGFDSRQGQMIFPHFT